jgi:hypothetical protein
MMPTTSQPMTPPAPISAQPPVVNVPINTPKPMTPPAPINNPGPVSVNVTPQMQSKPDLPPPPSNPTTIPFDEAPKTSIEPGEEMQAPKPADSIPTNTPAPTPAPQPPTQAAIQDIEI